MSDNFRVSGMNFRVRRHYEFLTVCDPVCFFKRYYDSLLSVCFHGNAIRILMRIIRYMLYALSLTALATSCSAPKDITYFQSLQNGDQLALSQAKAITLEPDDKVIILVHTTDPRLNALFNLPSPTTRIGTLTQTGSTAPTYSQQETPPYTVDSKGDINFPVLGKIHVQGMTAEQLSAYLSSELTSRDLAKNPIVTVEFVNLAVSVLGEVNHPGRVGIKRQDLTILDAISEAGDLTIYGLRDNVKVIRHENGTQKVYTVNLVDGKNLASSPVYYLKQNDVIYVEPNNTKKNTSKPSGNIWQQPGIWISMLGSAISVATMIITLTKK